MENGKLGTGKMPGIDQMLDLVPQLIIKDCTAL